MAWSGPIRLTGFVSHPSFHFSAHRHAYTFINGRFVKDRLFLGAIQRAFGQKLPRGRYPFYLLNLDIHPSLVDVNVHPAKTQVRFVNEEALLDVLTKAFKAAMSDMVFEDKASSWREQVVDQNALDLSQKKLDAQNSPRDRKQETIGSSSTIPLSNQASSSNHSNLQTEVKVNAALEAHRARIQARLRQHLHGEDIDLGLKANSQETKDKSSTQTKKAVKRNQSDSDQINSGRHDVERVTQEDLEAWRAGTRHESKGLDSTLESKSSGQDVQELNHVSSNVKHTLSTADHSFALNKVNFLNILKASLNTDRNCLVYKNYMTLKARQALRSVGRADEWWIQEASDGLMMVHLPTARVHALTDQPQTHTLSQAVQLSLSPQEKELDGKHDDWLGLGIQLSPFDGQIYRLLTVPKGLESESSERLSQLIRDTLSYRSEENKLAWAKSLLNLPLSSEARSFTLHWLESGGTADPKLPPFNLMLKYQDMLKRCEYPNPF